MTRMICTASIAALLAMAPLAAQKPEAAESILQTAIKKEVVDGDLAGAIEGYKKALAAAKGNRAIVAMALVHMAECYQKMGDAQARKIYEQVVRDYADQKEAARQARERLGVNGAHTTSIMTRQVWTGPQVAIYASVSPDGRFLSFVDQQTGNLALHDLTTGKDRPFTNKGTGADSNEYAEESTFAPDGKRLAYSWFNKDGRYDLRVAAVEPAGGAKPTVLYSNEDIVWIGPQDWSSDGKWIAVQLERKDRTSQLGLVGAGDGKLRVLKSVEWSNAAKMWFSPDGQYLAYDLQSGGSSERDIFILVLDGSREIPAVVHPADDEVLGWTPDGKHLLFASDRTGTTGVYALSFEGGRPQGSARLVQSDIGQARGVGLTRSGLFYFALVPGSRDLLAASVDFESGRVQVPPASAAQRFLGTNYGPDWSPDGRHLSYESYYLRDSNVLIINSAEGQTRELRPRLRYFNFARWSPDGRAFLAQGTDFKGRQGIYRIDSQTGEVESILLSAPGEASMIPQWSPDGQRIFYVRANEARTNVALVERDLASGAERELLRGLDVQWFSVAPDGKQLACATVDPTTQEAALFILGVAGGERRDLLRPNDGFGFPQWTPDGRRIVLRKDGEIWTVAPSGGSPRKIDLGVSRILDLRIHPDGRQIIFTTRNNTPQEVWVMENLLQSFSASKR